MSSEFSNDNTVVAQEIKASDAHGQAAMLLVESLIHGLIEKGLLSVTDAIEIVDTAREVKADTGPELGDSAATLQESLRLLDAVSSSLSHDIAKD